MRPIRNSTWTRRRVCGALLAFAGLALVAPGAEAYWWQSVIYHGSEQVRAVEVAGAAVVRDDTSAYVRLVQNFWGYMDDSTYSPGQGFNFFTGSNYHEGIGISGAQLYMDDEQVLPSDFGDEFVLEGKLPTYVRAIGSNEIAVGGTTYDYRAAWHFDLDFDLAGHSLSARDTELIGQLDVEARFYFVIWLPDNMLLEDGYTPESHPGYHPGMFSNNKPPAVFDSVLSCDLSTSHRALLGNWCRLQRAPCELRLRLIRTTQVGDLTYTRTYPIVDDEIPAVDKYLLDTRFRMIRRRFFRR